MLFLCIFQYSNQVMITMMMKISKSDNRTEVYLALIMCITCLVTVTKFPDQSNLRKEAYGPSR